MKTLLSIETSGPLCALAIHHEGRWHEDTQNVVRMHNQVVLQQLDRLAAAAGVSTRGFDAVGFGAGPGSFTGIRIAAAVAQGVAYACGAPVVPVSSSLALATASIGSPGFPQDAAGVLTITRSRRDAYYLAAFDVIDGAPRPRAGDRLHQGSTPPAQLPGAGWVAVGDRPEWWAQGATEAIFLEGCHVTALAVGRLALEAFAQGRAVPPAQALPIYVSGDSPWRPSAH